MESYSLLLVLACIHTASVFYITILIVECPFRTGAIKFWLFIFSLLVPLFGVLFARHKLNFISLKGKENASVVSTAYSPNSNDFGSGDCGSGDSGSCD
jgi:hypothetical protein